MRTGVKGNHFHCDINGSDTKCRAIIIDYMKFNCSCRKHSEVRSQVQNLEQVYYARELETKHVQFDQAMHPVVHACRSTVKETNASAASH